MDPTSRPSPRRQLQGTRPPPLRVSKESTKIRKPPPHPAARSHATTSGAAAAPPSDAPRRPIIIYDASPKIIHTKPSDFMSLVQRLTGQNSDAGQAATSPAARFASIERSVTPRQTRNPTNVIEISDDVYAYSAGPDPGLNSQPGMLSAFPPGILSPMPSNLLPPVSPGFFSPLNFDPSCLAILNDLNPVFQTPTGNSNVGFMGNGNPGNYIPSSPLGFSPSVLLGNPDWLCGGKTDGLPALTFRCFDIFFVLILLGFVHRGDRGRLNKCSLI
ncbi:hypothetical protein LUZ60_004187 [Juncus effusus]|nr:hypothetical protein LUZ60_004187 [Juncus effusus]